MYMYVTIGRGYGSWAVYQQIDKSKLAMYHISGIFGQGVNKKRWFTS